MSALIHSTAINDSRFTGWGKVFGNRSDVADTLFTLNDVTIGDNTLPGLGLNIVRYNAGACSWNNIENTQMVESPNIIPSRQIEGFWLDWYNSNVSSSSWDWSVDANQRSMLEASKSRGANKFELFSNSPMVCPARINLIYHLKLLSDGSGGCWVTRIHPERTMAGWTTFRGGIMQITSHTCST